MNKASWNGGDGMRLRRECVERLFHFISGCQLGTVFFNLQLCHGSPCFVFVSSTAFGFFIGTGLYGFNFVFGQINFFINPSMTLCVKIFFGFFQGWFGSFICVRSSDSRNETISDEKNQTIFFL